LEELLIRISFHDIQHIAGKSKNAKQNKQFRKVLK